MDKQKPNSKVENPLPGQPPSNRARRGARSREGWTISDSDRALMEALHEKWGAAIAGASQGSSIPGEFLAALIANESGGNPEARRLEAGVLDDLRRVLAGEEKHYGLITGDLLKGLDGRTLELASSSLGLTQVMGYHALVDGVDPARLFEPDFNLTFSVCMLMDFADRFGLDPESGRSDHEKLFRCWNTGSPDGKTHDPDYTAKGLARMRLYAEQAFRRRFGDSLPSERAGP